MRDYRFIYKPNYSNSYALIIGINKYERAGALSYAVNDAEEVRNVVEQDLKFPAKNITYLTDNEATRTNILRAFARFTRSDVDVDDRVLIFFAGHGHTRSGARGEVGFLVPYDADMNDLSTLIRWSELTGNADLVRAKHMLFIMDACYGGLALMRGLDSGSARFLRDMYVRYSRQVLTAGKADEVVSDAGGPIPNHSVFTGHLVEGIRGKAFTPEGILTANGLMAYVYGKVANDKDSNQTPHFGYFDGDGDFIMFAPGNVEGESLEAVDTDSLVVIPFSEDDVSTETTAHKINKVKSLLSSDSSSIELHDYIVAEVRRFLSLTAEDNFAVQGQFTVDELLDRISRYEALSSDLAVLTACIAYWAKPTQLGLLQKIVARSCDRLEVQSGLSTWINLRWYPLIVLLYCAGVAAVDGKRFDCLASIFYTVVAKHGYRDRTEFFAEAVSEAVGELLRVDAFKKLPGHERHYTPMSEYLFKTLQPRLDDLLFIGRSYEQSFDEFEVIFALVVADVRFQSGRGVWGPIGRFGWKRSREDGSPLVRTISQARAQGADWQPFRAGLFGGSLDRFNAVADEFEKSVAGLNWW